MNSIFFTLFSFFFFFAFSFFICVMQKSVCLCGEHLSPITFNLLNWREEKVMKGEEKVNKIKTSFNPCVANAVSEKDKLLPEA